MKLAIIPPISYLKEYSTDYHLVLAHLYKQSEPYRRFYNDRRDKGEFVIMDNGAAELGCSIEAEELVTLALQLRSSVLFCPDVLRDKDATLTATNHFLDTYAQQLHQLKIELMAVPQGQTAQEWYQAFIWLSSDPAVNWVGISKYVKGAFPARIDALRMIEGYIRKPCHLLGLADDIFVVEKEKKFRFVRSTDSAVPVKLGLQELDLHMYDKFQKIPDDEYFNLPYRLTEGQDLWIKQNITNYKKMCKY